MEPRLPPEIEREVFESAASVHSSAIPALLTVARRVHIWIEPFLYQRIHLDESERERARYAAALRKPPAFLASAVKHLVLGDAQSSCPDIDLDALGKLTGVTHVAIAGQINAHELLPVLTRLRIERLGAFVVDLVGGRSTVDSGDPGVASHAVFAQLTHLDLFDEFTRPDDPILLLVARLPALTHLAIKHSKNLQKAMDVATSLLAACPRLKVLISLDEPHWSGKRTLPWHIPARIPDKRYVLCAYEDWAEAAFDGMTFWDFAEEFIEQKSRASSGNASAANPEPDSEDLLKWFPLQTQ